MNQKILTESKNYSNKQGIRVSVPWITGDEDDSGEWWNETLAWTVEKFGLPGDRFMFHTGQDAMHFDFFDEKDANWFKLRWG